MTNTQCAILSYNHPEITRRCLLSARNFFSDEKITLVHNGSLSEHVQNLKESFPKIEHIVIEKNCGYSGGANQALKAAFKKNEWCLFLTNDTELIKTDNPPQYAALVAPLIYFKKRGRVDSLGGRYFICSGQLQHIKSIEEYNITPAHQIYVPGTGFLIHKKIFEDLTGFDEVFHTYWEDVDFSRRLYRTTGSLIVNPNIQLIHGIGKTCHKDKFYTSYLFHRNRALFCRRYLPWFSNELFKRIFFEIYYFSQLLKVSFFHVKNNNSESLYWLKKLWVRQILS